MKSFFKHKYKTLIFYILGLVILGFLIYRLDVSTIGDALKSVGTKIFFVFLAAIPWMLMDTLSIYNLTHFRVPFFHTMFNQLTGNGYNAIIPLAGLGGEPYKVKHFTRWLEIDFATRAIIQDRLLHMLSGTMYSSLSAFALLFIAPLGPEIYGIVLVTAIAFFVYSLLAIWVTVSNAPTEVSGFILKKLKFLEEYRHERLSKRRFIVSFGFKMASRIFTLLEIYVIFLVFGMNPTFVEVMTVSGALFMSVSLGFFVPQGMGVNEYSISYGFVLIGLGEALGLTAGLLRRARIIFWALFGVVLHIGSEMIIRFFGKNGAEEG
ncbi:MAG: lysylphosphatidylglycerol synthase transmembrane domain-containing protein [Bacteroidetes bacterium]|nr:lysylphosphatidylglycerol synthase transmembrane domain-containing protein [Bacteroidota bacterium]MDA1119073.1 lysylphosphatidylglycerol synthase transmembrane domain-containing protein [Bacteroidota bacterium]